MSRAVMQKVLDVMHNSRYGAPCNRAEVRDVVADLRKELAKPEQEPVAYGFYINQEWVVIDAKGRTLEAPWMRLYTSPSQRQELTDAEIEAVLVSIDPETKRLPPGLRDFARAVIRANNTKEKS